MSRTRAWIFVVVLWVIGDVETFSRAEEYSGYPATYLDALDVLKPGDRLRLVPGDYRRGLPIHFMNGTSDAPIVIESMFDRKPARFVGPAGRNTVSIINSSHVVIRNLILQGQGHAGDGVKAEGFTECDWTHHITLEGLQISDYGGDQQRVGISTKCPAWNWVIRRNTIIGAGTGIYLGNSDGHAPFIHGLIEDNVVSHTMGYNLQIKHQLPRGHETSGMPEHDGITIIRNNTFSKSDAAGSEEMARPNVLVGHASLAGPGLGDWYHIYGNVFYQNPHEALFQGEGNLALYNNLFVNTYATEIPAIAIQRHNWRPRNVHVFHNTVVARRRGISIRGGMAGHEQLAYANMVFADIPMSEEFFSENFTGTSEMASIYLSRPFAELESLDLYPRAGTEFGRYGVGRRWQRFTDSRKDFNGSPRNGLFPGAYEGRGTNPGRLPAAETDLIPLSER